MDIESATDDRESGPRLANMSWLRPIHTAIGSASDWYRKNALSTSTVAVAVIEYRNAEEPDASSEEHLILESKYFFDKFATRFVEALLPELNEKQAETAPRAQFLFVPYDRHEVERCWKIKERLSEYTMVLACIPNIWGYEVRQHNALLLELALARHPEFRTNRNKFVLPSKATRPHQLFSRHEWKSLTLLQPLAEYGSDAGIYITRPHCEKPVEMYINAVHVGPKNNDTTPCRFIVSCSNIDLQKKVVRSLSLENDAAGSAERQTRMRNPQYALTQLDRFLVDWNCELLNSCRACIERFQYEGRRRPSHGKLDYLLHVDDYLLHIEKSSLREPLKSDWVTRDLLQWHSHLMNDQKFVVEQAGVLRKKIQATRAMIYEQMNASSSYRLTRLTILAAIYGPLSFATGIFGMNIQQINNSTPQYYHVLLIGLPLGLLTAILPLCTGPLLRSWLLLARNRRAFDVVTCVMFGANVVSAVCMATLDRSSFGRQLATGTASCLVVVAIALSEMAGKRVWPGVLVWVIFVALQVGLVLAIAVSGEEDVQTLGTGLATFVTIGWYVYKAVVWGRKSRGKGKITME